MTRGPSFKQSQLIDWHSEPRQERGSSFFLDSDAYNSTLAPLATSRRAPARRRFPRALLVSVVLLIAAGTAALGWVAHLLRP